MPNNTRGMDSLRPEPWFSSTDFADDIYPPHGEFRLRWDNNLVVYEARGPFNLQAIQGLALAREAFLKTLHSNSRWVAVVHFQRSAIMTADAMQAWEQGLKQLLAQRTNGAALAWVAGQDVEGFHFMLSRYRRVFEEALLPFSFFDDMTAAREWAVQQLDLPCV